MTECGEGREGLLAGREVGVGEEAGEMGDKKGHPRYVAQGEMGRDEVVKLKEEERGEHEALKRRWREARDRSPSGSDSD